MGGFLLARRSWRTCSIRSTPTATDSSPSRSSPLALVCFPVVSISNRAFINFMHQLLICFRRLFIRPGGFWRGREPNGREATMQKPCRRPVPDSVGGRFETKRRGWRGKPLFHAHGEPRRQQRIWRVSSLCVSLKILQFGPTCIYCRHAQSNLWSETIISCVNWSGRSLCRFSII